MMEVRLIDANTLHAKIMKDNDNDLSRKENIAQFLLRIETAPTVEATPIRHGYWYFEKKNPMSHGACKCSECKKSITCRGQVPGPDNLYCRQCGSKNSDENGNMIFRDQEEQEDDKR